MPAQLLSATPFSSPPTRSHGWSYDASMRCSERWSPLSPRQLRDVGIYASGALFTFGWWAFIDAKVYAQYTTRQDVQPEEWMGGIATTLGMLIVSFLDKTCFSQYEYIYSGARLMLWKARLLLFLGFFMMAAGVCGSIALLVYQWTLPNIPAAPIMYFYWAIVVQNVSIMLSSIVLWAAQNANVDKYDLVL